MSDIFAKAGSVICVLCVALGTAAFIWRWGKGAQLEETRPKFPGGIRGYAILALLVVMSRLLVYAVGAAAQVFLGDGVRSLDSTWGSWDAHHYLWIAENGYTADKSLGDGWLYIVFFPLFPWLTSLLGRIFGGAWFEAGTAISWVSLFMCCAVLYKLAQTEEKGSGFRAVKYLLIFPFMLFLGIPYTESLFLLLSIGTLYMIRTHRWLWAGVLGLLAALTRNVGVLLCVPYLVELLQCFGVPKGEKRPLREVWKPFIMKGLPAALIPLGTVIYLILNYAVYGDMMMFMQIQAEHWGQRAQAFWLSIATTVGCVATQSIGNKMFLFGPQLVMMVLSLAVLPFVVKKLRPMYGAYMIVYVISILSPSWLLSYGRYLMCAAPLYLYLAQVTRKKWVDILLSIIFIAAALYLTCGAALGQQVL